MCHLKAKNFLLVLMLATGIGPFMQGCAKKEESAAAAAADAAADAADAAARSEEDWGEAAGESPDAGAAADAVEQMQDRPESDDPRSNPPK